MNKLLSLLSCAAMLLVLSCATSCKSSIQANGTDTVPYIEAQHYFAIPNVDSISYYKITSQKQLESVFGMAAVMGEGGLPTAIDFSKQFAIGIVCPTTNHETSITDIHISATGNNLEVRYRKNVAPTQMSYSIRPMALIFVDKKYDGNITYREAN